MDAETSKESAVDKLTREDVGVLIDAVKAWETASISNEMFTELIGVAMEGRLPEEEKAKRTTAREERMKANDKKRDGRREASVILQAKLIQIRDRMEINEVVDVCEPNKTGEPERPR